MDIQINQEYQKIKEELENLSTYIYNHPELGDEEYKAMERHTAYLQAHGFVVEKAYLGISTAFKAVYDSGLEGPTVALLSEYDALPEIGHGCGHNMIGTISSGVATIVSQLTDDFKGKVIVLGTPAEENNGAKIDMVEAGVFDDIDVALMAHPSNETAVAIECLAMEALQFEYTGLSAHAAACPEKGINALDGVIGLFNNINAMREHILPSARIHGIISEGGVAANIVPERAVGQFYVRATRKSYLQTLVEKVKNCAKASALATGASLKISNYEKSYDDMVPAPSLNKLVEDSFFTVGVENINRGRASLGSADAGNVSYVCPTVHAMFDIGGKELAGHTRTFADATQTPFATNMMEKVTCGLSLAVITLMQKQDLLNTIKEEYAEILKSH